MNMDIQQSDNGTQLVVTVHPARIQIGWSRLTKQRIHSADSQESNAIQIEVESEVGHAHHRRESRIDDMNIPTD